jgi:hypothetical protein
VQTFRLILASLVTAVWLVGYALAFYKGADSPDGLNVLMGLVLGWVFGGATFDAIKRIRIERKESDKDASP